jgi:hypothetical protein
MILCNQIPSSERCPGCPLSAFEERRALELQPHEALVFVTNYSAVMDAAGEGMDKGSLIAGITDAGQRIEKAATQVYGIVRDVVVWKSVGACEHYDGAVLLEDPGIEERLAVF